MLKKYEHLRIYLILWLLFFLFINMASSWAQDDLEEMLVPKTLTPGLKHLLKLSEHDNTVSYDPVLIAPVMDFLTSSKKENTLYYSDIDICGVSSYNESDFRKEFGSFLKLAFSPDIPDYIIMPSSVRLNYWKQVEGQKGASIPHLWKKLANLNLPVIVSGIQYEMTTPNVETGGYYGYDLNRRLILFKHKGRNVMISLSKQIKKSEVGKKGYVIGPDSDWEYFYSGEDGLTKTGLGWTSSYIYNSYSITIFYEMESDPPQIRCGSFKWLDAGWMGMNMAKKKHIYNGQMRYAASLKQVVENPTLPEISVLAEKIAAIKKQNRKELETQFKAYLQRIVKRSEKLDATDAAAKIKALLEDSKNLEHLNNEEMSSVLVMNYIKMLIGKIPDQKLALSPAD
ncbi:hypothetical protein QUF90_19075 [Desulfococcaceae bacterium HSG9]|nr:hypothetical protein [Desulfococcaceae bacterium HSG9]